MKVSLNKLVLLMIFSAMALGAWALVSEYAFTQDTGTYTEITGGTVLGSVINDDESFNAIPLGFTFTYNGVAYTEISIQTDAFVAFGPTVLNSTLAISSSTGTNNIASALNRDLVSRADGELMYLLQGTPGSYVFTIQWKNYRRVPTSATNDVFNFQIQIQQLGNKVVFAYGAFTVINVTTAQTVQVGLRGDANTDFNNRTTTTSWTATTAGTANNANCRLSDTVFPPSGLIFTYAPAQQGEVPLPAQNPIPVNLAMDVAIGTNLSWSTGGGTVDGYKVFFGTDENPSNIANGTVQTGTIYDPAAELAYSTVYYWKIVPFNAIGDALNCPVWHFTTLADPTITTYPYVQNFDTVTPPALPIGWSTINANADTYTWETYVGNAQTPPNSARIRYSATVAMDDWLVSPPLQLTANLFYQLSFWYRANSASYPEALSVYWGTAPNAASMTNMLFDNSNITTTTYTLSETLMQAPSTGTFYIGFHGHSPVDQFYLYLDSITISNIVDTLNPPTNLQASVINNNTAHLTWTAPTRALIGYKVYKAGTLLVTLPNPATTSYDDVELALGTYSYTVTAYYTTGESVPAGPVSVTIVPPANPPTNLQATVVGNDVTLTWNAPTRTLLGYKIYRNTVLLTSINSPTTLTYADMDLAPGTYAYTISAVYSTGETNQTAPVTITILPPNNPPTDLTATVEGNDVTLDWVSPEAPPTGNWITWCNDVLGNSVGTNAAADFYVAHRWTPADLGANVGGQITQVKFVPSYAACTYSIKIWTGGSAAAAGTLVLTQVVPTFTEDVWNLVILNTPVTIPATGDLYVGFECNTTGGYPAGCDAGPQIEGKGNMMYFSGAWSTLTALAPTLTYNWLINTFVQTGTAMKAVELTPIAETLPVTFSKAPLALHTENVSRTERALTGFKVYRDGVLVGTIADPSVHTFTEMDLANGTYTYGVTATYTGGESVPATVQAIVNVVLAPVIFEDGFETYADFSFTFAPWTLIDVDLSPTYGFSGTTFPGSEDPMAFIVFNPATTVPPITTLTAHGGAKMVASFAATTPPNNDWIIAPRAHLGTGCSLKFYAKSHTATYGLERFRVGICTLANPIPQGFQYITGTGYIEAPVNWTEYIYDLSAYDGQTVWIGIRCVSNDAFVFYMDDFSIHSNGGYVANDDPSTPEIVTELNGNYPNPFNPSTTISFSVKEATQVNIGIYNVKGQLVKTLVNEQKAAGNHNVVWDGRDNSGNTVSSGIYYYKMYAGKYSNTRKMIMMK